VITYQTAKAIAAIFMCFLFTSPTFRRPAHVDQYGQ
jgi:hypothetical protein